MKIRHLPDIDLARITVLPDDEQWHRLKRLSLGHPPHTYNPTRYCLPDILNEQSPLLESAGITPWEKIDEALRRRCAHLDEYTFNEAVSKSLHEFCVKNDIVSRRKLIPNWSIGFGQAVCYWKNLYTVFDGKAFFPFMDPRISHALTEEARRFAFSVMHERIRVPDPDFSSAGLVIVQFAKGDGHERLIRLHYADEVDLIGFDKLNDMVTKTYRIWIEVQEEREAAARKTGTDDLGPLFSK